MLDNKEIEIIKKNIKRYLNDNSIIKEKKGKFAEFFLSNAKNSLDSAKLLFEVSTKKDLQKITGFPDFNGFLWVVNSSYYSMFYMARALLESEGIKIKPESASVHLITFNALVYYFYLTGKIQKSLIEEFKEAGEEASEVLGKEKAKSLIEDYSYEKDKRGRFTYEMGEIAIQNKAETSLNRAKKFNEEIRKLLMLR
jgi:uncharacterized protein (UPF0332 family)